MVDGRGYDRLNLAGKIYPKRNRMTYSGETKQSLLEKYNTLKNQQERYERETKIIMDRQAREIIRLSDMLKILNRKSPKSELNKEHPTHKEVEEVRKV